MEPGGQEPGENLKDRGQNGTWSTGVRTESQVEGLELNLEDWNGLEQGTGRTPYP